jgi:lysophospholipase L1-like esterase
MPVELARLFALVLSLVGPAPVDSPKALQLKPGDPIVCIGDSITAMGGYIHDMQDVLNGQYPDLKIPPIINAGISGQKIEDLLPRFQKDVVDRKPAYVTISVGINNVWWGGSPNYKENLAKMVDMAQAAGIKVILLTPTLITEDPNAEKNKQLLPYVAAEKEIAAEKKCQVVDLHQMFLDALARKDVGLPLTGDGVHMAAPGDAIMALGVLRALGVPDSKLTESSLAVALRTTCGVKGTPSELADKLAKPAADFLPALGKAMGDKNPVVVEDAVRSIAVIGKSNPGAMKFARETLDKAIAANNIPEPLAYAFRQCLAVRFMKTDDTTSGNWKGVYGAEGAVIVGDAAMSPTSAVVAAANKTDNTWNGATNDPRALQKSDSAKDRIAACWVGPQWSAFDIDIKFPEDGKEHQAALYCLDWEGNGGFFGNGRAMRVEVRDPGTEAILDTRTVRKFNKGKYLVWNLKGHVTLHIVQVDGFNAVASGVFFDFPGAGLQTNRNGNR